MKNKILIVLTGGLLFWGVALKPVFALEHAQKNGLFSMDIPEEWHWAEYPQEVIVTYADGQTVAIDIQFVPSRRLSRAEIKDTLSQANNKMIKEGINAHHGTFIEEDAMDLDGVYATRMEFKTSPPNPVYVTYVSFFNKGYVFTITYGSRDENMRSMLDDAFATIKL